MTDRKITASMYSEQPNPDEDELKRLWDAEVASIQSEFEAAAEHAKRRQAALEPLIAATGFDRRKINAELKEARGRSDATLARARRAVADPPINFEAMHEKERELMGAEPETFETSGNPYYHGGGTLSHVTNAGTSRVYTSGSDEVAKITYDRPRNHIDARTEAYGEGNFDADIGIANGYLGFTLYPPSYGNLELKADIRLVGNYYLYADDEWYNAEYAKAEISTWIEIHQVVLRDRSQLDRWSAGGSELHPTKYGRFDRAYIHPCVTYVGSNNPVTIRVGVRLKSYARANGSRAILDFHSGSNHIWVKEVSWDLRH